MSYCFIAVIVLFPRILVQDGPFKFKLTSMEDKIITSILVFASTMAVCLSFLITLLTKNELYANIFDSIRTLNLIVYASPLIYYIFKLIYSMSIIKVTNFINRSKVVNINI